LKPQISLIAQMKKNALSSSAQSAKSAVSPPFLFLCASVPLWRIALDRRRGFSYAALPHRATLGRMIAKSDSPGSSSAADALCPAQRRTFDSLVDSFPVGEIFAVHCRDGAGRTTVLGAAHATVRRRDADDPRPRRGHRSATPVGA
jgi:hypothetical protein